MAVIMRSTSLERIENELFLDVLQKAGRARVRVVGTSMQPTLRVGDSVIVEAICDATINIGDIVLFLQDGRLCAHRVVKLQGARFITRGDANSHIDFPVDNGKCIGRVVAIERNGANITAPGTPPAWSFLLRHSNLVRRLFLRLAAGTTTS